MCENCEGFRDRENFVDFSLFMDTVRQLDGLLSRHIFMLTKGEEFWSDIVADRRPKPDTVCFEFQCPICDSVFELGANFYHGGASWRLIHDRQIFSGLIM